MNTSSTRPSLSSKGAGSLFPGLFSALNLFRLPLFLYPAVGSTAGLSRNPPSYGPHPPLNCIPYSHVLVPTLNALLRLFLVWRAFLAQCPPSPVSRLYLDIFLFTSSVVSSNVPAFSSFRVPRSIPVKLQPPLFPPDRLLG